MFESCTNRSVKTENRVTYSLKKEENMKANLVLFVLYVNDFKFDNSPFVQNQT